MNKFHEVSWNFFEQEHLFAHDLEAEYNFKESEHSEDKYRPFDLQKMVSKCVFVEQTLKRKCTLNISQVFTIFDWTHDNKKTYP
jgi:hypothetical protein